ncbi:MULTISPECIES: MCE family protein [Mycolicibacterium]|jgi:phospholipid/cholesterol/gamma-HCH transport system substrate-binding protein|uniref:Virulence factor Mce family protein n=4 Tax=Mycolicibacterium TaxID=1866885 RepID=A1TDX4_MYCVP|nr:MULTISPECIES: MlaD family protein [Mycolicibacterium]ABM15374.1 virulence factor Mce family protein [Mycolicibacterium vanbaalenii PYR-1]MCV7129407.1 MCE family protein [Mycolicibacterium vanbaalenii PYR-1]MDN4522555.1 MlaD family protein [Mycolicibacterium austroafricanum]MDW5614344.1 MlaD family protein [Mycolicibacterium sp. D5.8-2]QRZ05641.1 MCE family protein [Mycolicibacterium austroafricanum]
MRLTRQILIQMAIFAVIATTALVIMVFAYMRLPAFLGIGQYRVTLELPETGGLYPRGNVTYRGVEVGEVKSVQLTDTGVEAVLSLNDNVEIPANLEAEVHSVSSVGEQFVQLLPRSADGPVLKDGDVIPINRTTVPTDINGVLDATNAGLEAIPQENLQTVIDEAYTAVGGLGPELRRLVTGSTALAIDARKNLESLTTLIDQSKPVLDSQTETGDSIQAWAANLASISGQLQSQDPAVAGILDKGPGGAEEVRALFDRLQPTLPIVLANLVSIGEVAVTYQPSLEQLLVLLPQGTAVTQAVGVHKRNTKQDYMGDALVFNLNLAIPLLPAPIPLPPQQLPPPCTTGFLPAQQRRVPTFEDYPDRPVGNLYCRVPQDAPFNVRGARNLPCISVPGKRAPTWQDCESNEVYVPLNDGYNWKGDPNATLSGEPIPDVPPDVPVAVTPPPPGTPPLPVAAAEYDPASGEYVGPDGKVYTQSNLADGASGERPWQSMLVPPGG